MKSSSPVPSPAQVIRWANTRRFPSLPRRLRRRRSRGQRAAGRGGERAGEGVGNCHVGDRQTGRGSRDPNLYREVVDRIRCADTDVIINLTAGMGGDLEIGAGEE